MSDIGIIAIAATIIVAMIGWLGTRGTTSTELAGSYMREISSDNADLRLRVEAIELENVELKKYIKERDEDAARSHTETAVLRARVASLEAVLKRLLGDDVEALDGL